MRRRVRSRIDFRPGRAISRWSGNLKLNANWPFYRDVARLIGEYKGYGLAITAVTVLQEVSALWPVALLGQFVDRLATGDLGHVVWLFLGASLLYPGIVRGNTILRHKMFYETDFEKRVELTLLEADRAESGDVEEAGAAHTRVVNAVSGITNASYHILGSLAPVVIKIAVVSTKLLAYNRSLGLIYVATLLIPALMTALFNDKLRVLRDTQYSVISRSSGLGVRAIAYREDVEVRGRFATVMRERTNVLISLVSRSQVFLYCREISLVGSQFLIVFIALGMRDRISLTPGDFTQIVGYTTQVAVAFINTAAVLDAIISYSRAYRVFAQAHG